MRKYIASYYSLFDDIVNVAQAYKLETDLRMVSGGANGNRGYSLVNARSDSKHLRKTPSQGRSLKMVERILDATRRILKQTGDSAPLKISTNHIAKEARISVGSLYQYFPNTEAILSEVFRQILSPIQEIMRAYDSEKHLYIPREEFFKTLFMDVTRSEADNETLYAMHGAMKIYPALCEADKAHAEIVAQFMMKFLRRYGSTWPEDKLKRIGLYAYYLDDGVWRYREHAKPNSLEAREWEVNLLMSIIEQCFEEKRPISI